MKVAVDCRFLFAAGLGRYIREIVQRIIPNQPDWLFYLICKNQAEFNILAANRDNAVLIISDTAMYSIKEQWSLTIKIPAVDIYWSPHYPVPILGTRAQYQVTTIHDVNHLVFLKDLSLMQQLYARFMMQVATRKSDVILTDSLFSQREIVKYTGITAEKIRTVYIGIDKEKFKFRILPPVERSDLRGKYGLPEQFVLFVGNVKPHKNINGLLKAFRLLRRRVSDIELVITGRKENLLNGVPGMETLLQELKLETVVHFTGFIDDADLPKFYNLADVFVFPSLYEGFGLPPLEAMASGCPVVASNLSCIPEVCGSAVHYVNPHFPAEMAQGIFEVLTQQDLRQELIQRGFQRAECYNWDQTVAEVVQNFVSLKER